MVTTSLGEMQLTSWVTRIHTSSSAAAYRGTGSCCTTLCVLELGLTHTGGQRRKAHVAMKPATPSHLSSSASTTAPDSQTTHMFWPKLMLLAQQMLPDHQTTQFPLMVVCCYQYAHNRCLTWPPRQPACNLQPLVGLFKAVS